MANNELYQDSIDWLGIYAKRYMQGINQTGIFLFRGLIEHLLTLKLSNGCRLAIVCDDPHDCGFNKVNEIKSIEGK